MSRAGYPAGASAPRPPFSRPTLLEWGHAAQPPWPEEVHKLDVARADPLRVTAGMPGDENGSRFAVGRAWFTQ